MILTDEQAISMIKEYLATHKYATQNDLHNHTGMSINRIKLLASQGHYKLPLPIPKNCRHLFKKKDSWRSFVLNGSPSRRPS